MSDYEYKLRQELVRIASAVAEGGYSCSNEGNLSVRLHDDRILITPAGEYKRWMKPEDIVVIDLQGELLDASPGLRATSEYRLHLEAYHRRPDVRAIIHAHPPYATALTLVDLPYPCDLLPEVLVGLGDVPTVPYATPGTPEMGESIAGVIEKHDALLLSHHGSLNVAVTLVEALIGLERLEHAAKIFVLARGLSQPTPLPPAELDLLRKLGGR